MTKSKALWCRKLAVLFCTLLIFCGILPVTAYADNATVTTGSMYSYFQTFGSNGIWKDIQTPSHWITSTGEVAYCLQTSKDSPYNSGYHTVDGADYYNTRVLTGLQAILENGYPVSNGGYDDEQARYATANAIRFWLAENYCDGVPQYLNLNVNGDWIRGKSGYEDLYYWSLSLLQLARDQAASSPSAGSISFSPATVNLTENGAYFTGSTKVVSTINSAYGISDNLPSGSSVDGYTMTSGDTLSIRIPVAYEQQSYFIKAYGVDKVPTAKLFFWGPDAYNQQRVVTCVLDEDSLYVESTCTVNTPKVTVQNGSIQITKVNEGRKRLAGVSFSLYDESRNLIASEKTGADGMLLFSDIPIGNYFYAETEALPGYVLDSSLVPVSVAQSGETVTVMVTNVLAKGSISVLKTDSETGAPLPGVRFLLKDSSGDIVAEGDTDADGRLSFTGLLLGDYILKEKRTVTGYELDNTEVPVTISENGQTVEITRENTPIRGSLKLIKKDSYEDILLSGAGYRLYDSDGNQIDEQYTDYNGEILFSDLPYGEYSYQEFKAPMGFLLDDTVYTFEISEQDSVRTSTRNNMRRPGTLVVKKQDADGTPLAGAGFLLEYSADDGTTWEAVFSRNPSEPNLTPGGCTSPELTEGQLTTGEDGIVRFTGLRADRHILYRLTETKAPEGYSLMGGSLYVGTLPVESSNIYAEDSEVFDTKAYHYTLNVTATDDPLFRLPETGSGGFTWLPAAMMFTASPAVIINFKFKRRHDK